MTTLESSTRDDHETEAVLFSVMRFSRRESPGVDESGDSLLGSVIGVFAALGVAFVLLLLLSGTGALVAVRDWLRL